MAQSPLSPLTYGVRIACYSDNTYDTLPCPEAQACSVVGGVTRCSEALPECQPPERRDETVDLYFCLDEGSIGHCYNGNIIDEILCDVDSRCTTSGRVTRCVERTCLGPNGETIEGSTCLDESEVITCDDSGSVINRRRCGAQARCEGTQGRSRCVPEVPFDQFVSPIDNELIDEPRDAEMCRHDARTDIEFTVEPTD